MNELITMMIIGLAGYVAGSVLFYLAILPALDRRHERMMDEVCEQYDRARGGSGDPK